MNNTDVSEFIRSFIGIKLSDRENPMEEFQSNYFKKVRLRMIYGSTAFPLQIWKKQITFTTRRARKPRLATIGTIMVQQRTAVIIPSKMVTTVNFSACLTWNAAYGELFAASSAITIPIAPIRYTSIEMTLLSEMSFAVNSAVWS